MKKTLSTMAAAAVLMASTAVAPALAQTTAPASPTAPSTQTDTMTPPAAGTTGAAGTTSAAGAGMTGEYLTRQAENQISANDYIGKSIYNGEDKSIGSVTDLILQEDGGIVAAVVGVGGFLGIGQKNVAVPMDKITVTRETDSNDVRLTTIETADALKAAPEFMTLDDQDSAATTTGATDGTTTSSTGGAATTTAPAAGGATTPSTTTQP